MKFYAAVSKATGQQHITTDRKVALCNLVVEPRRYRYYRIEIILAPIMFCAKCLEEHNRRLKDEEQAANHEVPVSPDA